jgi:hypothetical protein
MSLVISVVDVAEERRINRLKWPHCTSFSNAQMMLALDTRAVTQDLVPMTKTFRQEPQQPAPDHSGKSHKYNIRELQQTINYSDIFIVPLSRSSHRSKIS